MQYRINPKNGSSISALGFGCMRFHKDEKEVERQLRYAIEQGVNYFDTAYIYGGSEATIGKILAKDGLRRRVNIATKLPHYLVKKREDFDKIFSAELARLQTDYIDYYLMHMLSSAADWRRLVALGIVDWVAEKKRSGQLCNIGFSFHGTRGDFTELLDQYDWDICMIQYNYLDEFNQAGRGGLEYAEKKGIPVVVMEPLRGGTLVDKLPPAAKSLFQSADASRPFAEWGLRWVLNAPQVLCALSGMGTMQQLEQNIAAASRIEPGSLGESELALYAEVRAAIQKSLKVECTGCGYCMPCPAGVDIPMCFASLNDTALKGRLMAMYWYIITAGNGGAANCVQCGKCEPRCPQSIPIREKLAEAKKQLEGFPYRPARFIVRRVLRRK